MKNFEIPEFYRSPIISKVKTIRKQNDPRKKDFKPSILDFGNVHFHISRHFGFCYGVENAIEIAYKAIQENPNKKIYLLSQMIHNPEVNKDLQEHGIHFLQDTSGNQLIAWENIKSEDIVIIPAFGTTLQTEKQLEKLGVDIQKYNTTCPFVEKVWNRSEKLSKLKHTIIIHGKYDHEESKATFSRSEKNGPALVIKNMEEAKKLGAFILGEINVDQFKFAFEGKYSKNFDPNKDLDLIGVVNQTTMLAKETQEITDYLRDVMKSKFPNDDIKNHIADTRDTLCYATNDNQTATLELLNTKADLAIVVGGYNSSNTMHLVEILEQKFPCFFIESRKKILDNNQILHFDIHSKTEKLSNFLPEKNPIDIIITSGASCPDVLIDEIIQYILKQLDSHIKIEEALENMK